MQLMATELTDDDGDNVVEFTETVEDVDGDTITETLELDKIDGAEQTGSDRDPSWFSYSRSSALSGGTRELTLNCEIDLSGINQGSEYEFVLTADDGQATVGRVFTVTADDGIILEEGFESGNLSDWIVNDPFEIKTDYVRTGTYSAGVTSDNQVAGPFGELPLGSNNEPNSLEFHWYEVKPSARGAGWRILNSGGDAECSFATNNPEWRIEDANGIQDIYPGDGYDRWIRVKFIFDWANGTFGYEIEDEQSGTVRSGSGHPLTYDQGANSFVITSYTSGSFGEAKDTQIWMDDILVK